MRSTESGGSNPGAPGLFLDPGPPGDRGRTARSGQHGHQSDDQHSVLHVGALLISLAPQRDVTPKKRVPGSEPGTL